MAAQKMFRKALVTVVQGDTLGPMFGVIGANATASYMKPGKLVIFDTNDNEVKEAGAAAADASSNVGILGYEGSPLAFKPADRDTAYAVGDHVAIHNTPGMRFRGWLTPGSGAVSPGSSLGHAVADTSGNVQVMTAAMIAYGARGLAVSLESITPAGGTGATACWMRWVG
jgi:hypothetical protein